MKNQNCLGCNTLLYSNSKSLVCTTCSRNREITKKLEIYTATDYDLTDDYLFNALCFLHGAGALNSFLEKVHATPEMMFYDQTQDVDCVEKFDTIDKEILDEYEDLAGRKTYFAKHMTHDFGWNSIKRGR